ncbi:MAG: hypothetical protein LBG48_05010 [Rickettsiales bacterium]|nr:hypothetical protein [Rickettsiales bacterium]
MNTLRGTANLTNSILEKCSLPSGFLLSAIVPRSMPLTPETMYIALVRDAAR